MERMKVGKKGLATYNMINIFRDKSFSAQELCATVELITLRFYILHVHEETFPVFLILSNNSPKSHYFLPAHC